MGVIEDAIFDNYKKSLEAGDFDQAKKATMLAKNLKELVELENFQDFSSVSEPVSPLYGNFFEPLPYRYDPERAVVVRENSAITLTDKLNKLFYLFSENESGAETINIITKEQIETYLWGTSKVSKNAVKITVRRLRDKIEQDPKNPKSIINIYGRGYIFIGKSVKATV